MNQELQNIQKELKAIESRRGFLTLTRESDVRRHRICLENEGWRMPVDAQENVNEWEALNERERTLIELRTKIEAQALIDERIRDVMLSLRRPTRTNHRAISARKAKKAEESRQLQSAMKGSTNGGGQSRRHR